MLRLSASARALSPRFSSSGDHRIAARDAAVRHRPTPDFHRLPRLESPLRIDRRRSRRACDCAHASHPAASPSRSMTALPAWWISYLALLGRPTPAGAMEWYPPGGCSRGSPRPLGLTFWVVAALGPRQFRGVPGGRAGQCPPGLPGFRRLAGRERGAPAGDEAAQSARLDHVPRCFPSCARSRPSPRQSSLARRPNRPGRQAACRAHGRTFRRSSCRERRDRPGRRGIAVAFLAPDTFGASSSLRMGGAFAAFALQGLASIHDRTRGGPDAASCSPASTSFSCSARASPDGAVALRARGLHFSLRRRFRHRPESTPYPST